MEAWNSGYQNEKALFLPKEHSVWGSLRWGTRQRIFGLKPQVRRARTAL